MTTNETSDTINVNDASAQLQIYDDQNITVIEPLRIGQIVRVEVTSSTPNVQLHNCYMIADDDQIQIISAGQPVSVFSGSVWILESTTNTASFKLRAFSIGRWTTRELICSAAIFEQLSTVFWFRSNIVRNPCRLETGRRRAIK